jgi:hypothetical protein
MYRPLFPFLNLHILPPIVIYGKANNQTMRKKIARQLRVSYRVKDDFARIEAHEGSLGIFEGGEDVIAECLNTPQSLSP